MNPHNCYEDARRADAYARLEFPGTYYLAYRDLPELLARHARGRRAVDFGCGTGRSTRFLERLGFEAVGVDISEDMVRHARAADPEGDYRVVGEDGVNALELGEIDLVQSVFTFDNIPTRDAKLACLRDLAALLGPEGRLVSLVSAPEIYLHEWASFSTKDYPENARARSGDRVRIVITDIDDPRPVEDVVCSDEDYCELFGSAGLELLETHRPLGHPDEDQPWVNETRIAPWTIYVLEGRRRTNASS